MPFMKATDDDRSEPDIPGSVIDLLQANIVASERSGGTHPVTLPAEPTVGGNEVCLEAVGILEWLEPIREFP